MPDAELDKDLVAHQTVEHPLGNTGGSAIA